MNSDDRQPVLPPDHGQPPPPPPPAKGSRTVAVVVAVLLIAIAAVGVVFAFRTPGPTEPLEAARATMPRPEVQTEPEAPPVSTEEADSTARTSLEDLTDEPEWSAWLSERDLLRRFVSAVSALDSGESARPALPFLAPPEPYRVRELEDGRTFIDPSTWDRYEPLSRVIEAIPVEGAARAYREVQPLLQRFYLEGARPGARFDATLDRLLARVSALPLPDEDTELIAQGVVWAYADPQLEAMTQADKQFLRLGPTTLRTLQQKATRLRGMLRAP